MPRIPSTSKAFERWYEKNKAEWPPELQKLGTIANRVLWQLDNNPPHVINTMEERKSEVLRKNAAHLIAFAEAYGRWKEFRRK